MAQSAPSDRYIRQSGDCEAGTAANGSYKLKKSFSVLPDALPVTLPFSQSMEEHPTLPALRYERSFQAAEILSSPPWTAPPDVSPSRQINHNISSQSAIKQLLFLTGKKVPPQTHLPAARSDGLKTAVTYTAPGQPL